MSGEGVDRRKSTDLERHLQTILITLTTGAIMFATGYVFQDNATKAASKIQLEFLTNQIVDMRSDIKEMKQQYVTKEELSYLQARLNKLEQDKYDHQHH